MSNILIIDSDCKLVHIMQILLRRCGHNTRGAHNQAEALLTIKNKGVPDIMLLDFGIGNIPLINGFKSTFPNCVVITTALCKLTQNDTADILEAGSLFILRKPFKSMELLAMIKRAEQEII